MYVTDSGETATLRSGQHLAVHLSDRTWDPPISSAPGVLHRQCSVNGYPTSAPVDAVFKTVGPGSADITATVDAACFHTSPRCMLATQQWTVHLFVRKALHPRALHHGRKTGDRDRRRSTGTSAGSYRRDRPGGHQAAGVIATARWLAHPEGCAPRTGTFVTGLRDIAHLTGVQALRPGAAQTG